MLKAAVLAAALAAIGNGFRLVFVAPADPTGFDAMSYIASGSLALFLLGTWRKARLDRLAALPWAFLVLLSLVLFWRRWSLYQYFAFILAGFSLFFQGKNGSPSQSIPTSAKRGAGARKRADALAFILVLAYFVFLVAWGGAHHRIESLDSAEMDDYVFNADLIRMGELPRDPYHPMLYPLMTALLAGLFTNTFIAAKWISALAAAGFLLLVHRLGRRLFNPNVGFFSMLVMMAAHQTLLNGMLATSDMLFAALSLAVMLLAVRAHERPTRPALLALSVLFAAAYATRYAALTMLPFIVMAICGSPALKRMRDRIFAMAVFGAGALASLLPHFYFTAAVFGDPFYNGNWKNLAFKLYGAGDWSYLNAVPFQGMIDVVLHSPARVLQGAAEQLLKLLRDLDFIWGNEAGIGIVVLLLALAGAVRSVQRKDCGQALALTFLLVYILAVATIFLSMPRLWLPVLPIVCFFFFNMVIGSRRFPGAGAGRGRIVIQASVLLLLLFFLLRFTISQVPAFIASQPRAELQAALTLQKKFGRNIRVMGSNRFLQRYVDYKYFLMQGANFDSENTAEAYFESLFRNIDRLRIDFILVGRLTIEKRPPSLLFETQAHNFLQPVFASRDVVLYRTICHEPPENGRAFMSLKKDSIFVEFNRDGSIDIFSKGQSAKTPFIIIARGNFSISKDILRITFDHPACGKENVGVYRVLFRGDTLRCEMISDSCRERRLIMERGKWGKKTANLPAAWKPTCGKDLTGEGR